MAFFGEDYVRAKRSWLYQPEPPNSLVASIFIFIALVGLIFLLQTAAAAVGSWLLASFWNVTDAHSASLSEKYKGLLVALAPASLLAAACAYWSAGFGGQNPKNVLALRFPKLGPGGWISVLVGFLLAVVLMNAFVLWASGIDPSQYTPRSDGSNSTGAVERTMADLADEPLLFVLSFPAIALAVPILEELVFRGAIFAALRNTPLGALGTVLVTSAAWAGMHVMAAPFLFVGLLFLMGLLLGYLLLKYGSLWVPIACHCLWNTIQSFLILSQAGGQ